MSIDSCDPNVYIDNQQRLVTKRPVKDGEELCFIYNVGDTDKDYWDPGKQ